MSALGFYSSRSIGKKRFQVVDRYFKEGELNEQKEKKLEAERMNGFLTRMVLVSWDQDLLSIVVSTRD
jgi:hypothetical protein